MTVNTTPNAERQLFPNQIALRLEHALAELSARQCAVFTLRHYDSLSLEDISLVLKLDTGTVKAHLFRAIGSKLPCCILPVVYGSPPSLTEPSSTGRVLPGARRESQL